MRTKNEEKWLSHYKALRCYLESNHQLPDKKKVENRGLLNWWKYNKRLLKTGRLTEERLELLRQLNALRYNKLLEL
ncbi:Helicase associated domain protein [Leyella stercorea]|uniref:Helicase associated domain protein n=1 Tax=Leyella stercorea TaxID=363265 RepID=UPI00266D36D3|nr:Helicase associated domain protein [Leyella stercorea]